MRFFIIYPLLSGKPMLLDSFLIKPFYLIDRVGEHITSTTSDGQHVDVAVEKIISHPQYSRSTINNDIALMKLATPIKFGKYVKSVCLPQQGKDVSVGTQCYITGNIFTEVFTSFWL